VHLSWSSKGHQFWWRRATATESGCSHQS